MSQSQGQTDFGPLAPEELEEDDQNDFMTWVEGIGEAAPLADAADGNPKVMRLPPAAAEIQFELRRMTLVVGAWLETTEVQTISESQTLSEDLFSLLRKVVQLCSVVEKRIADNATEETDIRGIRDGYVALHNELGEYESDVAASSEPRRKVLKRNEESLIRL